VDQDDSVLEAVEAILKGRNHQVQTAKSAAEAQDLLRKEGFDVVVADQLVADGGKNFQDWIGEYKPEMANRLILTCTLAPQQRGAMKRNGRQTLHKPFKAAELLAAVDALLLNSVDAAAVEG
jgi:DNA-binding response OmpR family regulator